MSENKETFETWSEEITVASGELMDTVREMLKDVSIHRMQVVNNRTEKVVVDVPAVAAIPVAIVLNIWALVAAAVLYAADFRIIVERRGSAPDSAETTGDLTEEIIIMDDAESEPVAEKVAEAAPVETVADRCQGMTKAGAQCKRKPKEGSAYCGTHQPG